MRHLTIYLGFSSFLSHYKVCTNRSNSELAAPLQAHTSFSGLHLDLGMHSSALSRQDTLPTDDPLWSYPAQVPGQPAPIPPRNEPLLYIPSIVHASVWCSKNSQLVNLPPPTTSEPSILNDMKPNDLSTDADKTLITGTSATDIINPEHYSAERAMNSKVCIIDTIPFYSF